MQGCRNPPTHVHQQAHSTLTLGQRNQPPSSVVSPSVLGDVLSPELNPPALQGQGTLFLLGLSGPKPKWKQKESHSHTLRSPKQCPREGPGEWVLFWNLRPSRVWSPKTLPPFSYPAPPCAGTATSSAGLSPLLLAPRRKVCAECSLSSDFPGFACWGQ